MSQTGPFTPKTTLALVLVGIFAFSGFTVLTVYAPDLRTGDDGGAHALSKSAVGYAGMVRILKAQGVPVVVSRSPLLKAQESLTLRVLTPTAEVSEQDLKGYDRNGPLLVVLPKWNTTPEITHPGWVRKVDLNNLGGLAPLKHLRTPGGLEHRSGTTSPQLRGVGAPFGEGTHLPLGRIDQLQTLAGPNWQPILVDEGGRMVLARWGNTGLVVLADPDLLNTQGIRQIDTARAGLAILEALHGEAGVAFDVTLNGFKRPRSVLRLMFEPPLVGATLCLVAAALLMGFHAAARFGPALRPGRAFALGKRALIDNSADLIRAAHKEHQLAGAYSQLIQARVAKAVGERETEPAERLARLTRLEQRRRSDLSVEALSTIAANAATRGETLSIAAKLFQWKSEMTRDRR